MCHSVWLFDICNPPNALSELVNFLCQESDLGFRPPYMCDRVCIHTATYVKNKFLGRMCHSVTSVRLFDLYNPSNALSEPVNFKLGVQPCQILGCRHPYTGDIDF